MNMQTTDVVDENVKRIGEMFPNCLTEVKDENGCPQVAIDFDQLRQELSKNIVDITCVTLTCILSMTVSHRILGVGIGTLIAMIGIGRVIAFVNNLFGEKLALLLSDTQL